MFDLTKAATAALINSQNRAPSTGFTTPGEVAVAGQIDANKRSISQKLDVSTGDTNNWFVNKT